MTFALASNSRRKASRSSRWLTPGVGDRVGGVGLDVVRQEVVAAALVGAVAREEHDDHVARLEGALHLAEGAQDRAPVGLVLRQQHRLHVGVEAALLAHEAVGEVGRVLGGEPELQVAVVLVGGDADRDQVQGRLRHRDGRGAARGREAHGRRVAGALRVLGDEGEDDLARRHGHQEPPVHRARRRSRDGAGAARAGR
jgi:hypothetical protein